MEVYFTRYGDSVKHQEKKGNCANGFFVSTNWGERKLWG